MNHRTKDRRFLLKATTLGSGALLVSALGACGSSTTTTGSTSDGGQEASTGPCGGGPCGSIANPPDAGSGPCGGHVCGSIALPPDASDQ